MPSPAEINHWRSEHVYAEMWWCGDEVCDCHQGQIIRNTPNFDSGWPWVHRDVLWRGKFVSEPTPEEMDEMVAELAAECVRRGIERHEYEP